MVIKRINPLSFAKVVGILYAMLGFLVGGCISLVALTVGFAPATPNAPGAAFAQTLGTAAVVLAPIFYGGLGFVMTLIGAALYNVAAGMVGGIQFETQ